MGARLHNFAIRRTVPHNVISTRLENESVYPLPGFRLDSLITDTVLQSSSLFEPPLVCDLRGFDQLLADSPEYLGPEVKRERVPLDSSDIYSCGAIIFEMMTGHSIDDRDEAVQTMLDPFQLSSRVATHATERSESISSAPSSHIGLERLEECLVKCLEAEPADRYVNLDAFLHDLTKIIRSYSSTEWSDWKVGTASELGAFAFPNQPVYLDQQLSVMNRAMSSLGESPLSRSTNVWGVSGSGKTFLIKSWIEKFRRSGQSHRYAAAKLDEETYAPLASFSQIFNALILSIMDDASEDAGQWRESILDVVGISLPVFLSILPPETRQWISHSKPVPIGAMEWATFNPSLKSWCKAFLQLFATPNRPLIMVVDDAQWMPVEELDVWRSFLDGQHALQHNLTISAYHTTVNQRAPVEYGLSISAQQLEIPALPPAGVQALIAACVRAPFERISILSQLLCTETRGNPLFLLTVLSSLVRVFCHS